MYSYSQLQEIQFNYTCVFPLLLAAFNVVVKFLLSYVHLQFRSLRENHHTLFRTCKPQLQYDQRKSQPSWWPDSHATLASGSQKDHNLTSLESRPQQTALRCRYALAYGAGLYLALNMTHQGGRWCKTQPPPYSPRYQKAVLLIDRAGAFCLQVNGRFRGRIWILHSVQKAETGEKLPQRMHYLGFIWLYIFM